LPFLKKGDLIPEIDASNLDCNLKLRHREDYNRRIGLSFDEFEA
jgi:hypothetical protein